MKVKVFDLGQAARDEVRKAVAEILPSATDTNVGGNLIDRQAALDALDRLEYTPGEWATNGLTMCKDAIMALPSAQPNLSEAYSKAVFTWLMDYQIRAAELKGRYTPYEVLSWVVNDWRKEHERSD